MSPVAIAFISVILLFILIFLRMPVAFVMLLVGIGGYSFVVSPGAAVTIAAQTIYSNFSSYSLIVVPLFVWMGFIAFYSGLSSKIFESTYKIVGDLPGGLAIATVAACTAFGAICGSTTATAATMSSVAFPEMNKYNYKKSFSTATIASAAIIGVMVPPSVIFILYGVSTGESISALFMAGVVPGFLLMTVFMLTAWLVAVKNPEIAPAGPSVPLKEKFKALFSAGMEVIVIFLAVMGGLFAGWFTPTEAGGVGVFATLLVTIFRKSLTWDGFKKSLSASVNLSAMILFLVASDFVYSKFLAVTGLPTAMANMAASAPLPPVMVLILILFVYFLLGLFIDGLALVLMTTPIFYPIIIQLGYDPVWFGVIVVLALGMGVITPPVGANVYVVAGVAKDMDVMEIFSGVWPYLIGIIVCLILLIIFPGIALFLPGLL
jgi:tripartite ATP-independent transporter DctM subunit